MDTCQNIEERCNKGLQYARTFVCDLCRKYDLKPIEVYAEDYKEEDNDRPARFSCDSDGNVYIAYKKIRLLIKKDIIERELRHEFRHYLQFVNYSKLFLWWMVKHQKLYKDFQNSTDTHNRILAYKYCPLEIDACAFANNDKVDEDILKNASFDLNHWRKILEENVSEKKN